MSKLFSAMFVAILALGVCGAFAADKAADKGAKKPAKSPEEMFKILDKDGDGFVTKEEFLGKVKPEQKEAREKQFTAKDKDKDGKISKDEFLAAPAKKGGKKAK
jgi:Ca2+-binding EF-hand superfamily protein